MKVIVIHSDPKSFDLTRDEEEELSKKQKKKRKKSWKERQQEKQIRRQRAQEAYRVHKEREAERKPRQWPKGKILVGVCFIALIFVGYGAWQYHISQLPPAIGDGTNGKPPPTGSAPDFSLKDIDGTQFSLKGHNGEVIAIHFMAVGCGGQIYSINDHQLTQLKTVCNNYCSNKPVTVVTVAVATCANSDLARIRANYGITWALGNDYDDGIMDIVNAYTAYSIKDGTIVLIDKTFDVAKVYTDAITADTLSSKISQLLGA